MGIRGLSLFINEYIDVLEKYRLCNCNVVIDGKNLAHYLHRECTGINVAFGGDFDKYADYVQKFFEGLQSCGVNALVILDGAQPLNGKKFKTAQERAESQIAKCLSVNPDNQYSNKIFPPMCLQVFVTTLHKMGILVLQADYEADDEIAAVARILNCIVISEDTDFYMTGVAFVPLPSVGYKTISKKKFIPCKMFNVDTFCKTTGVNRSHLALLGTLMGNDYIDNHELAKFHKKVAIQTGSLRKQTGLSRAGTIQAVIKWMARRKQKTAGQIIDEVVGRNWNLRKKILQSVNGYSLPKSALLDSIPYIVQSKKKSKGKGEVQQTDSEKIQYVFDTKKSGVCYKSPLGTDLVLRNGKTPPQWFVKAYRENKIPREVADILTQGYFFSPAQVECISFVSSYLVVEPIVRSVYTFLWKGCTDEGKDVLGQQSTQGCIPSDKISEISVKSEYRDLKDSKEEEDEEEHKSPLGSEKCEDGDSDVVVEGDSEDEGITKLKCMSDLDIEEDDEDDDSREMLTECKQDFPDDEVHSMEIDKCSKDESADVDPKADGKGNKSKEHIEHLAQCCQEVGNAKKKLKTEHIVDSQEKELQLSVLKETAVSQPSKSNSKSLKKGDVLLWYIRKKKSLWCKRLNYVKDKVASQLPSLSEVGDMSVREKKLVFYRMIHMDSAFKDQDLPDDLELILNFIIYWFRNSQQELNDCHALTVLVCVFMYYIIDGKIGRVRTWKGFETVESCRAKVSDLLKDPSYCKSEASVMDLLAAISNDECLVAGNNLFKYHHMDKEMDESTYRRRVVHSFSEYQACVYFLQLLNSLLCSPFPLLSIQFLWGGTFSYNVLIALSGTNDRIAKVVQILGQGTCLERLFCKLFSKLESVLKFSKSILNKKDKFNSKKFAGNYAKKYEEVNESVGKSTEVKKKKKKSKKESCYLVGNRFAGLVSDSESESDG